MSQSTSEHTQATLLRRWLPYAPIILWLFPIRLTDFQHRSLVVRPWKTPASAQIKGCKLRAPGRDAALTAKVLNEITHFGKAKKGKKKTTLLTACLVSLSKAVKHWFSENGFESLVLHVWLADLSDRLRLWQKKRACHTDLFASQGTVCCAPGRNAHNHSS